MQKILKKSLKYIIIAAIALIGLSSILKFESNISLKLIFTLLILIPFNIAALCCISNYNKPYLKTFSLIATIICMISSLAYIAAIWEILKIDILFTAYKESSIEMLIIPTIITLAITHISLLLKVESKNKLVKIFKKSTIVFTSIVDILLLFEVIITYIDTIYAPQIPLMVFNVLIIIIVGISLLLPIINMITKDDDKE